jgi:probable F420-dependent oxidoreductase
MRFGILVNTQAPPDGERIPELYKEILAEAELAEQVGFQRVLVPEHHMMPDGYLPQPLVMLAAIAARTRTVRLGTGIMHLPERDPIHVAEEVSVLDNLSGGRVDLGVGLNLVQADYDLFHVSMKSAAKRFEEQITILRDVWTTAPYSYEGQFYRYDRISVTPRPVQRAPHPPVWIGAMSEPGLKRAGRMGVGWVTDPLHSMTTFKAWAEIFRDAAAEAGVTPGPVILKRDGWVSKSQRQLHEEWWPTIRAHHLLYKGIGVFGAGRFNTDWEPGLAQLTNDEWTFDRIVPDRLVAGTPDQVVDQIGRWTQMVGADDMVFSIRHANGPDHKATMECIELFGAEVLPQFNS